jgi:hypothetical protein
VLTDFRDRVEVFVRWGVALATDTVCGVLTGSSRLVPNGRNDDCAKAVEAMSCICNDRSEASLRSCLSLIGVQAVGVLPVGA